MEKYDLNNMPDLYPLQEFKKLLEDNFVDKKGKYPEIVKICGVCAHWIGLGDKNGSCIENTCKRWKAGKDCIHDILGDDGEPINPNILPDCTQCEFYIGKEGELSFENPGCEQWVDNPEMTDCLSLFGLLGTFPKISKCRQYQPQNYKKAQKGEWECLFFEEGGCVYDPGNEKKDFKFTEEGEIICPDKIKLKKGGKQKTKNEY